MNNLPDVIGHCREMLETKYKAREIALAHGRALTRTCANAIRSLHRGESEIARITLDAAGEEAQRVRSALATHPDLYFAGYVQDAHKELAEAETLFALIHGSDLPTPESLGIAPAAYLNGLAEAASEGRRYCLDCLRRGEREPALRMLAAMDEILSALITVDYPDAITDGLRRTCDALRAVVERTRGDVTNAVLQFRLLAALEEQSATLVTEDYHSRP
jgi:translin